MSRSNQYIKKYRSSGLGDPVGIFEKEIDAATAAAVENIQIHDEFSLGAQIVSCQVVSTGLTGTLDGVVQLTQSNDGSSWDDIIPSVTTLDTANKHDTLEKVDFSGQFLGANFTKTGITGGKVKLVFIVKHR